MEANKQECKDCAVQQGTHVPAEAVAQIQEPSPALKNGYFDGDDDDEDGTPVFQSAEEVIRRSAEVRELRAGDVICIVQLVNDEYANEQHARLTSIDDPDADTELAWVLISDGEAKAYYEDKQAQKRTALHPKRIENVIFRMNKEGDSQAAETAQALRARIAELEAQLAAVQQGVQTAVPVVRGEVLVTVSGFTGSGKSAIAGEIEIMCRALGLQVEWPDGVTEKNMTHADWTTALELYNPRVRIIERNVPRNTASGADQ